MNAPAPRLSAPFSHAPPRPWVRALAQLADAAGLIPVSLDKLELMARSEAATGLSDWGAPGFHEALDRLLTSANSDARLNAIGRFTIRNALLRNLQNRLRLVEACRCSPEALDRPLRRPIVIAAPPRTGSTLLQRLLAAHPDAMSLPLWMAVEPLPAPSPDEWAAGGDPRRRRQAERTAWAMDQLVPSMKVLHETAAHLPVECSYLQLPTFMAVQWWSAWPLYSYAGWLLSQDGTGAYSWLRQTLQVLQASLPGDHWVLKAPGHFVAIEPTHAVLGEALIVQLHRDPARVFASLNSMISMTHHLQSDEVDFDWTSRALVDAIAAGAQRTIALRERSHPDRWVDLLYRDLARDPLGAARLIIERAGLRWDAEVRAALQGYLDRHPRDKNGKHVYPLVQYAIAPNGLRRRFADYMRFFGVPEEG